MSEQTNENSAIFEAIAKAQGEIESAKKDNEVTAGSFKYKYADLQAVLDAIKNPLKENGLSIHQGVFGDMPNLKLVTTIQHSSGATVSDGGIPLIINKNDMQGFGSALTYARRYGVMAAIGVATEDDDGVAAGSDQKPKNSKDDPSWRGPLGKTKLVEEARKISADIGACEDTEQLALLQDCDETKAITGQLKIDMPAWWDHIRNDNDEKQAFDGISQQFENKFNEIQAAQQ